jgi:Transposase
MLIVGCDFHPSWQQIAWLDSETGETGEGKLVHAAGEAKQFYAQLPGAALVGMEATGNSQWFIELVEDLGHVIWIGDAAEIRASYVRKQKTDKRDAAHILKLMVQGRFPRLWTPDREQRDLRQLVLHRHKLVMIRSRVKNELQHLSLNKGMQRKARLWSEAGLELLRQLPLKPWASCRRADLLGLLAMLRPADRKAGYGGAAGSGAECGRAHADDAAGSGTEHGASLRAHNRRCKSFSPRQAGSQLCGPDSARRKFGRTAEAGRHQQARQPVVALLAGGSSAKRSALRSSVPSGVFTPLPSKTESGGESGSGAQVSGTTLLDAAHPDSVSRDRSHREQLAGGPGRRKLDRQS